MPTSRNKSDHAYLCPCQKSSPAMSPSQSLSTFASSTAASFGSCSSSSTVVLLSRPTSPTRVNMYSHSYRRNNNQPSASVRLSLDRPISPNRSISVTRQASSNNAVSNQKRSCACSPTTHPGSFRCAFHRALMKNNGNSSQTPSFHSSSRLNFRRSAMTNSLVRIGGVEGELVKRALSALIRPSSHHQRRRAAFQPRLSRLSAMSKVGDC